MLKHFRGLTDETAAKSRFLAGFSALMAHPQHHQLLLMSCMRDGCLACLRCGKPCLPYFALKVPLFCANKLRFVLLRLQALAP